MKTIRSENATIASDERVDWGLTQNGHIFTHRRYNYDWWDNLVSVETAPQYVLAEADRLEAIRKEKEKREHQEFLRKEKEREDFLRPIIVAAVERAGGWEVMEKKMKKVKIKHFTPVELTDNGKPRKPEYRFTIKEAKRIVEAGGHEI